MKTYKKYILILSILFSSWSAFSMQHVAAAGSKIASIFCSCFALNMQPAPRGNMPLALQHLRLAEQDAEEARRLREYEAFLVGQDRAFRQRNIIDALGIA